MKKTTLFVATFFGKEKFYITTCLKSIKREKEKRKKERKKYIKSCYFPRQNATLIHMFFWTVAEALSHSTRQNVSNE